MRKTFLQWFRVVTRHVSILTDETKIVYTKIFTVGFSLRGAAFIPAAIAEGFSASHLIEQHHKQF
jgi:hypothetical protein